MLKDINIKINGLNDKISLEIVNEIREILEKFSFLDLRRFKNIIITSHFERDVEVLTSNNKNVFKNRYRASQNTFALVLTIPKEQDFELLLVVKSGFIKNLLQSHKSQNYKDTLHILHHELAHIHDNNKKIDVFKDIMKNSTYKGIESVTYPIAQTLWSEYIANFISSKSAKKTDYPLVVAQALEKSIRQTSFNIKNELMAYKINKTRNDLIKSSMEQIESLLKSAAYLIGYLSGMNITLEQLDEKIDLKIETSYFKDIWDVLKYELASIHQVYPHGFINLNIYKNLSFYIETFYSQMGIVLDENEKKELQIHIM